MSVSINGSGGLTFNDNSVQSTAASGFGFKNRIINGAMVIDQRNAGASITPTNSQFTVDRWLCALTQLAKYTAQQNAGGVTPPAGFSNYLGLTSLSSYSVLATDTFFIRQNIEGFNTADFAWGTASAVTVTLSFTVRSSITGTHSGSVMNYAGNRSYPFTFTVNAANTWETKSVTIPGDTTGTWNTNNSGGITLNFNLGSGSTWQGTAGAWAAGNSQGGATGSVSVVGTNGATFYITGVQLEKGSTATSFDYRPYGTELQLCQRYYERGFIASLGTSFTTGSGNVYNRFKVTKRAAPTVSQISGTALTNYIEEIGISLRTPSALVYSNITTDNFLTEVAATFSAGFRMLSTTADILGASAEL
jgi:hypothetical protein